MTSKPYTTYAVEGHSRGRWKRTVFWTTIAVVMLLLAGAGGSYIWFRSQVEAANKRVDPEIISVLASKPPSTIAPVAVAAAPDTTTETEPEPEPESPNAMNILVLGSDRRAEEQERFGRSDSIMLVHIDPDKDYLSIMSLPRDLRVDVPRHGKQKINAAFAYGGPALTILTVEQLTGVDINHYLEVDFKAFEDITDALGGVYVDVDRRYYNDDAHWELIKLAPGYQLLGGKDALDYVRFRHDLNGDFGRMERQQRFLAAMREQAMGWELPLKLPRLIGALFDNVSTDLGANDILKLAYWGIRLGGERIRQIALVAATDEIDGISYVIATDRQIRNATTAFLTPPTPGKAASSPSTDSQAGQGGSTSTTAAPVDAPDLRDVEVDVFNGSGRTGEAAAAKEWLASLGAKVVTVGNAVSNDRESTVVRYPDGLEDHAKSVAKAVGTESVESSPSVERVAVILGMDFAVPAAFTPAPSVETIPDGNEWKALSTMVPFALQAPAYIPEGYSYYDRMPPSGGTYDIEVGGRTKPALKMIYRLRENGGRTDQYMGITQTTWTDAPAASKGQEVERNGITYTIVGSSGKVDHIWWKSAGVLHWVSNTLSYLVTKEEMLKMATSMIDVPGS